MIHKSLRPYKLMSGLIAVFLLITAGAGLLNPTIYRVFVKSEALYSGLVVQDLASLIAAPLLVAAMWSASRGSLRGFVAWMGLLIYVAYYYAFFCFGYTYTVFYPLYLALVALALWSLIGLLMSIYPATFARHADDRMPVRLAAFVLGMTIIFVPIWLMAIVQGIQAQQPGEAALVFVLDLCILIPAMLFAAVQIWNRRPAGYVIAGPLLVKAAISGLLLTGGSLRQIQLGFSVGPDFGMYIFLALTGSVALVLYMRHLHPA